MKFVKFFVVALGCLFFAACGTSHQNAFYADRVAFQTANNDFLPAYLTEKQRTLPPFGYVDFCSREPQECPEWKRNINTMPAMAAVGYDDTTASTGHAQNTFEKPFSVATQDNSSNLSTKLTRAQTYAKLVQVNNKVNMSVRAVTDPDGFGVTENWRIPDISGMWGDIGDCEDYALLKRKILMNSGFDYKNLSMAVVRQPNNDVHAVLVVRTDFGDYVLDNIDRSVRRWHDTNFTWIKKQSVSNPTIWVKI